MPRRAHSRTARRHAATHLPTVEIATRSRQSFSTPIYPHFFRKHSASILGKLDLAASEDGNRHVLVVLAYLNS